MKHLLPCIALILMLSTAIQAVGQDTYEILRIYNANSITIGNRQKKVGDRFNLNERIDFANKKQSFRAQKMGTSKIYYFSKETLKAKKAKSLKDYFINNYHKVKGSTRSESGNFPEISQGEHNIANYPEKRIALVIGNGNYNDLEVLPNALNDARDVSDRLKQLGFDVATLYDADINDMQTSVTSFFQLAQSYQVALIYFAGHGLRYEGKDYLLAIDRGDLSIKDECSLDYLIEESEKWKSNGKVMIFVIDACRNQAGFANAGDNRAIEAKKGTAILQSTSSGQVAMDSDAGSGNSPFARAFINGIGQSGNDMEEDFFDIRREVMSNTANRQNPRTSFGGGFDFYFCKGCNDTPNNKKNELNEKKAAVPDTLASISLTEEQISEIKKYYKGLPHTIICNSDSINLIERTAQEGDKRSQYILGLYYYNGAYPIHGYKWIRLAAEQGYTEAIDFIKKEHTSIGGMYLRLDMGDSYMEYRFGRMYEEGDLVPKSYIEAAKYYKNSAEHGNCDAQYALSRLYHNGYGVPQSFDEAFKWALLAAKNGLADAQYWVAMYYLHGTGCKQSDALSKKWLLKAANQEDHQAQFEIGFNYLTGLDGYIQSGKKAEKWLLKAARSGHGDAQYWLGFYYDDTESLVISNTKRILSDNAIKWYRLAAQKGQPLAIKVLKEHHIDIEESINSTNNLSQ